MSVFSFLKNAAKQPNTKFNFFIIGTSLMAYSLNRYTNFLTRLPHIGIIFKNHFNDYLGAMVFIAYLNTLLIAKGYQPCKTLITLLLWGIVCSCAWEGIAPIALPYSTADWWDCAAYLLGMITYWLLLNLFKIKKTE